MLANVPMGISQEVMNVDTVDAYKNALWKINVQNYEYFEDVYRAYLHFSQKLMTVLTDCKTKRIKGNTKNWFDGEALEKLSLRDKLFKTFNRARLHINKEL